MNYPPQQPYNLQQFQPAQQNSQQFGQQPYSPPGARPTNAAPPMSGQLPPTFGGPRMQQRPVTNGYPSSAQSPMNNVTKQMGGMQVNPQQQSSAFAPYRQPGPPSGPPTGPPTGLPSLNRPPFGPPSLNNRSSGPPSLNNSMNNQPPLSRPPGPPMSQLPMMGALSQQPLGGPSYNRSMAPNQMLNRPPTAPSQDPPNMMPSSGQGYMPPQNSSMMTGPMSRAPMGHQGPPMPGQPRMPMGGSPMQNPPIGGIPQRGQMNRQAGQMAGPMAQPQAKRIDPNQMPNPIQVMKDDQTAFNSEKTFATMSRGKVPPLVSTKCNIQDDGNCSPRYMRSTVYSIPCNQDLLKESGIPMAIVATPFAKIPQEERQIHYVMHGSGGPVRCNRCKAYMNPHMQFIDGGRRFVCNICSHSSEVPSDYFCHLDHQGRRADMYERPELCFGSYEFIATEDYCKDGKLPGAPAFIFMIDVSYQSVQQGMLKLLSEELTSVLDTLPKDVGMEESKIKVGFVTYSSQLHFYNVKGDLPQPQMMVMTDTEDAFVPLQDGFLVDYKDAKPVVDSLLEMLPELFKDTRDTDVVLGPVIKCGVEALKSAGISGKLYIFHSSLPIAEAPGKLKNREDRKLLATDKEKNILMPQGNYYMNLVKECVDNGVSIDLFLFPNSYVDVATIGLMVTQTGGQVYRYSYFKEASHGVQFVSDLRKNFDRYFGFDAIMRLRCSTGLRPVEFYGCFVMNNTTDVELACLDSDKAIAIEFKHDDKIPEDGVAFIQCALLYTSVSGQRRLRIHNLSFSTCSQLAELYRCCELDTTVNYFSKYALRQVLTSTPQAIKDNLIQKCVQILACYRQHCATPSTSGQLILPECMKLLPLYINSLIKSDVLAGGSEMSSDDRAFLMQACLAMNPTNSSAYLYPRLIALHSLDLDHEDDEIPEQIRCLGDKFNDNGVYLLENTISMFIWVGLQVDQKLLQDLFSANSIGQLDIDMTQLPELDTLLSKRVRQIIGSIQSQRQRSLKLTIVRQRDKLEPWFKHYIVEDAGFHTSHMSYVDFLCHVHKQIRDSLS